MENEEQKPLKTKDRDFYLFALRIAGDFGASIAVPVIVFVIIGQYLDRTWGKTPLFTVLGFVLAALVSGRIIYRKAKGYGREYQALINKKQK